MPVATSRSFDDMLGTLFGRWAGRFVDIDLFDAAGRWAGDVCGVLASQHPLDDDDPSGAVVVTLTYEDTGRGIGGVIFFRDSFTGAELQEVDGAPGEFQLASLEHGRALTVA